MLCVLAFVLGFFLGGTTVSLLREEVKKAEEKGGGKGAAVPPVQTPAAALIAPTPTSPAQPIAPLSKYMPVPMGTGTGGRKLKHEKTESTPSAVTDRNGKKMCRATGVVPSSFVPPSFVSKPANIPFRCPKCSKTSGRRGPLLTKNALRSHMLKCRA